ncbi:MAG TPA: DUF1428 domain-containing protein, partial [Croceibacterium sp.]|nr:DUF1428 domain-containing protein [Croceibacterium sp.]
PVPEDKKDAYRDVAEKYWPVARANGALEHVEAWEADVPDGTQTDFRKAVALEDGEKVVFSWVVWPDKATADASNEKLMSDPRMEEMGKDMPFDGKRMVYGGFEPIVEEGRPGGGYVDGFVVPVPDGNREAYRQMAAEAAKVFLEHGAVRDLEAWGVDTPVGEITSFPRSVEAADGESVVFSFVEWPDEATRNAGWEKVMADERMKGADMPFDGKRMFWGGFAPIVEEGAR